MRAAERAIGRRFPLAFGELYLVHDGGGWLGHNLNLLPLDDGHEAGEGSVTRAAAAFRGFGWPVPDEVVVIGGDGAFLRARTAYLLPPDEATTAGLDALDVPAELRHRDPDDTTWARINEWASPTVPPSVMDAHEARLTAADLHRIASTA